MESQNEPKWWSVYKKWSEQLSKLSEPDNDEDKWVELRNAEMAIRRSLQEYTPSKMCMSKLRLLIHQYDNEEISISKFLEEINNHFLKTQIMKRQRNNMEVWTPAELAIYNAMQEVEKMEGHVLLTDAVVLLSKAKDKVADFIDATQSEGCANG